MIAPGKWAPDENGRVLPQDEIAQQFQKTERYSWSWEGRLIFCLFDRKEELCERRDSNP